MANKLLICLLLITCKNSSDRAKTIQIKQIEQLSEETNSGSYYTCSMHPEIRESKPGKCPICGMNLTLVEGEDHEDHAHAGHDHGSGGYYTCSMHPEIRESKPGKCPICGMNLTFVESENEDHHDNDNKTASNVVGKVKLRKKQLSHFRPTYFTVTNKSLEKKVRLLGTVVRSEARESNIPARVRGRVERVYIKSTGSMIKSGDPVVDIYSPELITAGEEYLVARRGQMLRQAAEKLKLWGVKPSQYQKWRRTNRVPKKITIYSPVTGIVKKHRTVVGKYMKEGESFCELYDLSSVWVEIDVYEHDANLVKLGQKVALRFIAVPGETIEGEIDFISPFLSADSRTLKVRTTIDNSDGKLKPGMIADVSLQIVLPDAKPLVVPRTAVIDTGKRQIVWLRVNDREFQAQVIQGGYEAHGYLEVKKGLAANDQVVLDGNFLLDAQAQLFGGYQNEEMNDANAE